MIAVFFRASVLDCEIPEVELEDGSVQSVLEVSFPDGQSIQPCCINDDKDEASVIPCTVTFQSSSPVTFTTAIIFTDGKEKYVLRTRFIIQFCVFFDASSGTRVIISFTFYCVRSLFGLLSIMSCH